MQPRIKTSPDSKPHEIRKTMNNCPANILVYYLVNEWNFSNLDDQTLAPS
jgi:hypothetical protein